MMDPCTTKLARSLLGRHGELWAGTGGGLCLYSNGVWQAFSNPLVSHKHVYAICERRDGRILAGFYDGLYEFDRQHLTFKLARASDLVDRGNNPVTAIHEDRQGRLWFGCYLRQIERIDGESFSLPPDRGTESAVRSLFEDASGTLTVLAQDDLYAWTGHSFESMGLKDALPETWFRACLRDREGSLWIGTGHAGLARLRPRVLRTYGTRDGLTDNDVWSIFESKDGVVWIGTSDGITQVEGGRFSAWTGMNHDRARSFRSVIMDSQGSVWCGAAVYALWQVPYRAQEFWPKIRFSLDSSQTRFVFEDRQANIWAGSQNSLTRFLPKPSIALMEGEFLPVSHSEQWTYSESGIIRVWSLRDHWEYQNRMWERHEQPIFLHVPGASSCPSTPLTEEELRNATWTRDRIEGQLSNYDVRGIVEDQSGVFWIATAGGGLNRIQNGQFSSLQTEDGLLSNHAFCLLEDNKGALWIGTD